MAHILIAEDDPSMRQFLTMALEKAGHHVTSCADGLAAFYAVESIGETIDLLLSDIVMPGMDGIELSQKATKMHPKIKVLFITGFSAVAMDKGAANNEQTRVMSKPFHLNDLVAQVTEIVGNPSESKTSE
ncbi:MAG TPA: response regulator [Alphaproteobacteria bacterium]|nr:response regulator [Alphaproteobacteria bacterium]HOO51151.1 response regulator [Alphaproteobacteria bacterium]